MSIIITKDITCDGEECLDWLHGGVNCSVKTVRQGAKKHGWLRYEGKDLCPTCAIKELAKIIKEGAF